MDKKNVCNILITGATGFIGKNLKEYFENKYNVFCPNRDELDLLNQENVKMFIEKNSIEIIIHAANTNSTKHMDTIQYDSLEKNLRMFFNLAENYKYFKKMYYFGSGAEYDSNHYIPQMREEYFGTYIPTDAYGFSKYIMSVYTEKAYNIFDLRLFGVYGKYEEYNRRFISNNICRALKGLPILIHQNVIFDYLWIEDLCKIMDGLLFCEPRKSHYNITSGQGISLFSLAQIIKKYTGSPFEIIIEKAGEKKEYTGNNERFIEEKGDFTFTKIEVGIQELITYYRGILSQIDETNL